MNRSLAVPTLAPALLALALAGCADDAVPILGDACDDAGGCPTGELCLEGVCVDDPAPAPDAAPVPPPEPDAAPIDATVDPGGAVGDPCDDEEDCLSGPCIEASGDGRRICSGPCDPNDPATCPDDLVCAAVTNAGPDRTFLCFPAADFLCRPCADDSDCGGLTDRCLAQLDGQFCARACDLRACPDGFECRPTDAGVDQCVPPDGVCAACFDPDSDGYGTGPECLGPDCAPDDPNVSPDAIETCNARDDDCDDAIDEGFDLQADSNNCGTCGTECAIEGAVSACEDGQCVLSDCLPDRYDLDRRLDNGCEYFCEGDPAADETCDGTDEDCDGRIDEGGAGADAACDTGELGRCSAGVTVCEDGMLRCPRRDDPLPESCDGVDEDCDGAVDEGDPGAGVACVTGQPGICADGLTACADGEPVCQPRQAARAEACNGADDDCDGSTDEGCPLALTVGGDRNLTAFGGGGGSAFRLVCGAGQLAVGVDVRSAAEVDQVRVICQAVALAVNQGADPFGYGSGAQGGQGRTGVAGGGGGGQATLVCPAGSFLHALRVRSGARVDQATFTCARVDFTGYPNAPVTRRTDTGSRTFGGNGGGANAEQRCADGEFMAGLHGRAGGRVDRLGPVCRRYQLNLQ